MGSRHIRVSTLRWVAFVVLALAATLAVVVPGDGRADIGFVAASGQNAVPDVEAAIRALSRRPDGLGADPLSYPTGTICKHYQGFARVNAADGTPYVFLTKSGNAGCPLQDDDPGHLFVIRMGSRPKTGERMGSNMLPYGSFRVSLVNEPPAFAEDKVVADLPFNGTVLPNYGHPGGMQIVGNVLVVGAEVPYDDGAPEATLVFLDISDPEHPTLLQRFNPPVSGGFGTDPVGMTPVKAPDGACCRYLVVAAGGDGNEQVRFFLSEPDANATTTTLDSGAVIWTEVGRYSDSTLSSCMGVGWPTAGLIQGGQHQMLNFVREGGLDGQLYLLGGRRDGTIATPLVSEYLELYAMDMNADGTPNATCPFHRVLQKEMDRDAWANEGTLTTFSAAAGVYASPTGELIVYSTRHDAYDVIALGPGGAFVPLAHHIPIGEYRHTALVRSGSPLIKPTAVADGPFAVDEGSQVTLTGHGEQAHQKAYVQLFEDDGVGRSLPGLLDSDEWMSIGFEQRDDDSFDDLAALAGTADDIDENAGSVRWFAPPGCTISLNDYPRRSDEWPGPDTVLLRGTGGVESVENLDAMPISHPADELWPVVPGANGTPSGTRGYDDDVGGVTFYHQVGFGGSTAERHDCESYYNAPIGLEWDTDGDGTQDATGASVQFSAATLDGPRTLPAAARAKHPTDTSEETGVGEWLSTPIQVRNVAPVVSTPTVVDSLGQSVVSGSGGVVIRGLPVTLALTFTDPGVADTQTASVAWGDGSTSTAFDLFSDASGGRTGQLRSAHVFTQTGTVVITATVTDDDGGATTVTQTVTVLTLEAAIQSVADRLTQLIGTAASSGIASALRAARDELIGNLGGSPPTNGALDRLKVNDPVGAITKLKAAIADLQLAEARGATGLRPLEDLLGLVAEGIANDAYLKAKAKIGTGTAGQQKTLATIAGLITQGHTLLGQRRYAEACDAFRQATDKSRTLMK